MINEKNKLQSEDKSSAENFSKSYFHIDIQDLHELPDFGLCQMSLTKAAERLAVDMWFSGDLPEIKEPEGWNGSEHDPKLLKLLENTIKQIGIILQIAVDSGRLDASRKRWDLYEKIIPEDTYVKYDKLYDWLLERNYKCGDIFDSWFDNEVDLSNRVCQELIYLRSVSANTKGKFDSIDFVGMRAKMGEVAENNIPDVIAAYKALVIENKQLKELHDNVKSEQVGKIDRPLGMTERGKLQCIIAALCDYSDINPEVRGSAQQISRLTEDYGYSVSDDTVSKTLNEIRGRFPKPKESKILNK